MTQDDTGGVVARVEADLLSSHKILIEEIFHAMSIGEKLLWTRVFYVYVVDQSECGHRAWMQAEAAHHPLLRCERKLAFVQHMLQRVYVQVLVAFHAYEIVTVPLVVAHEDILAVSAVYVLPVGKRLLNREERRVGVDLIWKIVCLEEIKDFLYAVVVHVSRIILYSSKVHLSLRFSKERPY